jgi:hypothetical protein
MRMQNAMQEKLAADLMNERATREEQMQTHNAEIQNLTAATEAQVDGIRRDAEEKIARVQAEWKAATLKRNTAAAAAAEAEIKAAREEAAAAERRLKADMDERIKKLYAQREEQQAAMEALVARINKLQSASSAATTKKIAKKASGASKASGAPLCRGKTAEGCACQRKSWSESGYCHDHEHQAKCQAKKK